MTISDPYRDAIARIGEMLRRRHEEGLGPGLSLALTTRDGLLATSVFGHANADSLEPVREETLFQIGSITKHFTAIACMRLHEQGLLDLQAPITDVLDWFDVQSRYEVPITIHHLLTHTAGIVMMMDGYPSPWWQAWQLRETQLSFEPGARLSYSNVGFNVLQCVIETVTGKRFDAALRELIFEPLGMLDTYGEVMNGLYDRMAKGHKYAAHDDRPVPRPKKQAVVNWYEMSQGCGSVVTTAGDLAIFLRMLLREGIGDEETRFLSESSFQALTHPYCKMEGFFKGTSQGYGVLIEKSEDTGDHRRIIGGGENLGYEAAMYGDFEAGVGLVLLCNSFDIAWGETRWILETLLAASRGEALPDLPELSSLWPTPLGVEAGPFVGTYTGDEGAFEIRGTNGDLELGANGQAGAMERLYGDNFITQHPGFDHAMLTFGRDEEGNVVEAFQLGAWYRTDRYGGPTAFEHPEIWDVIAGQYRAFAPLVPQFRIFHRKGQLICQSYGGFVDEVLHDHGGGWYSTGDAESGERMHFDAFANGKALRCRAAGGEYYRVRMD